MKELTVSASAAMLDTVTEYVNRELKAVNCPPKAMTQIDIAVDEIFSNISRYAYAPGTGSAVIRIDFEPETRTASITFTDQGIPYNPLTAQDPDLTLTADQRPVGGLGLYLVKKLMDQVNYEYADGCNRLTIRKML